MIMPEFRVGMHIDVRTLRALFGWDQVKIIDGPEAVKLGVKYNINVTDVRKLIVLANRAGATIAVLSITYDVRNVYYADAAIAWCDQNALSRAWMGEA